MSGRAVGDRWVYQRAPRTPGKTCKDCRVAGRPAPHPGPRCASCHRVELRRRRLAAAGRRVERDFDISPELYDELYEFQGGKCYGCRRATGASKRLAVDHDHTAALRHGHDPKKGCRECVRGLVCSTCNDILAHFRDDPAAFERMADYLRDPPFRRLMAARV